MTQASEQIARQFASAANVKNIWGGIVINVKAYGAKGTPTDDTSAFQAAIDYAKSIGMTEITIPSGSYTYGTLTNTEGIVFVGDGVTISGITEIPLVHIGQVADMVTKGDFTRSDDFILTSSFATIAGTGNSLNLHLSYDGTEFLPLNFIPDVLTLSTLRDPSIMYREGYFHIAFTAPPTGGGVGFRIGRSVDLISWELYDVNVPSGYTKCWAPEWFVDGDDVYVIVSLTDGTTQTDITGATIDYFKQYYMKVANEINTQFLSPVEIVFSVVANKIDGFIFKNSGTYHYFVKNEYNKTISQYTLTASSIETGATWQFLQTINYPVYTEAPAVVKLGNDYYLYVDGYSTSSNWCAKSTDLATWGTAFEVGSADGSHMQHVTAMNGSQQTRTIVEKLMQLFLLDQSSRKQNVVEPHLQMFELGTFMTGTTFSPPRFDALYTITGASPSPTITIESITVPNNDYRKRMRIYFCLKVGSGNTTARITIRNTNNIITPNNKDFTIAARNGTNDMIIILECLGNNDQSFRLITPNPDGDKVRDVTIVDLSTLAVGGVISSLAVQDETYYTVSGTSAITINNFDMTNVSGLKARIYFGVQSSTAGASLTLKKASAIATPGGVDFVISVANGNNDAVFELRKMTTSAGAFRCMNTYKG